MKASEVVEIDGVLVQKDLYEEYRTDLLTTEALAFIVGLQRKFGNEIEKLRRQRKQRNDAIDSGAPIDFPQDVRSKAIRDSDWKIMGAPETYGVELVSPAIPKMIVQAAISSSEQDRQTQIRGTVTDFEDAHHWDIWKALDGQRALKERIGGSVASESATGKTYTYIAKKRERVTEIKVRPNGFGAVSVEEIQIDGKPIERILLDFGLYFIHNAKALVDKQEGPFFYIPKLENSIEARTTRQLFEYAENKLNLPRSITKTTIHIETFLAAFEIDNILFELAGGTDEEVERLKSGESVEFRKSSITALGFGWHDYTFDLIRLQRNNPKAVWPQASDTSLQSHSMNSVWNLIVKTGCKRGIVTMGGMAVQLPDGSGEPEIATFLSKAREFATGARGVWIAHPDLALAANRAMREESWQWLGKKVASQEPSEITASDLLDVPSGVITYDSFRENIERILEYSTGWLRGVGCSPFKGHMEDVATTERARAEIWTWVRHKKTFNNGTLITNELVLETLDSVYTEIQKRRTGGQLMSPPSGGTVSDDDRFDAATRILRDVLVSKEFVWSITPILFTEYKKLQQKR